MTAAPNPAGPRGDDSRPAALRPPHAAFDPGSTPRQPTDPDGPRPGRAEGSPPKTATARGKVVLVVDDDPITVRPWR
jgi:hypothetical protein